MFVAMFAVLCVGLVLMLFGWVFEAGVLWMLGILCLFSATIISVLLPEIPLCVRRRKVKRISSRRALKNITKFVFDESIQSDSELFMQLVLRQLCGAGYVEIDNESYEDVYFVPTKKSGCDKWGKD